MSYVLSPVEARMRELVDEGGQFAIKKRTIKGVPYTVFTHLPESLRDFYAYARMNHDKADFLVYQGDRLTYGETFDRALAFSAALAASFGIKKGDRVAILTSNIPEWVIAFIAVTSMGAVAVPLNAWWKTEELAEVMRECAPKLLIADRRRAQTVLPLCHELDIPLIGCRLSDDIKGVTRFEDLLKRVEIGGAPTITKINPENVAAIFYTSGSTGPPKGVVSAHRAINSTLMNWSLIAASIRDVEGAPTRQHTTLVSVPLFHATGCIGNFMIGMILGRKLVLMDRWDVEEALKLIETEKVTHISGVPTMALDIMNAPDLAKHDTSSLVEISGGGAARPAHQVQRILDTFPGVNPVIGYGLTETNALGCIHGRQNYIKYPGAIGRPVYPTVEMKIVDEKGKELSAGEAGEIIIRCPANFTKYWKRPEDTQETLRDGWVWTGDIATMDEDGVITIVDRKKDIIIRGGENIASVEVEDVVHRFPGVADVAVFGLPDERLGEIVACTVQVKRGESLDPGSLREFVGRHLADYKVPSLVFLSDEALPRLGTGKLDKRTLRERFSDRSALEDK